MNLYQSKKNNWADPLSVQFQRGTRLLKFVEGVPTAWVDKDLAGLVIADTLLSLGDKHTISNAWYLPDAMIDAIQALTPGVRTVDCVFYAGTDTTATDGGGELDFVSRHICDAGGVPLNRHGAVKTGLPRDE